MQQKQIQQIEHLSKKDQKALAAIFADSAAWGELFLRNRDGSPRTFWDHQKEDLRSHSRHIIHQDGRDVGKSVCIIADLLHYAFTTKGGSGLVAAPHQGHLDTLIDELEFQLGENPDRACPCEGGDRRLLKGDQVTLRSSGNLTPPTPPAQQGG